MCHSRLAPPHEQLSAGEALQRSRGSVLADHCTGSRQHLETDSSSQPQADRERPDPDSRLPKPILKQASDRKLRYLKNEMYSLLTSNELMQQFDDYSRALRDKQTAAAN